VVKPTPIFTKLDESVVDEELARLRDDAADSGDGVA
jgi:methionyl-tRNA synthetase